MNNMVVLKPDKLTKYEKARIIGARSLQISMGVPMMVKLTPKKLEEIGYNLLEIAKMEFEERVISLEVVRDPRQTPETKKK